MSDATIHALSIQPAQQRLGHRTMRFGWFSSMAMVVVSLLWWLGLPEDVSNFLLMALHMLLNTLLAGFFPSDGDLRTAAAQRTLKIISGIGSACVYSFAFQVACTPHESLAIRRLWQLAGAWTFLYASSNVWYSFSGRATWCFMRTLDMLDAVLLTSVLLGLYALGERSFPPGESSFVSTILLNLLPGIHACLCLTPNGRRRIARLLNAWGLTHIYLQLSDLMATPSSAAGGGGDATADAATCVGASGAGSDSIAGPRPSSRDLPVANPALHSPPATLTESSGKLLQGSTEAGSTTSGSSVGHRNSVVSAPRVMNPEIRSILRPRVAESSAGSSADGGEIGAILRQPVDAESSAGDGISVAESLAPSLDYTSTSREAALWRSLDDLGIELPSARPRPQQRPARRKRSPARVPAGRP